MVAEVSWSLDLAQCAVFVLPDRQGMKPPEEPRQNKETTKPSRLEEARRIIEEYANDLREIIKKLRRHLN
ncbi:hypothetical protein [Bradyrhizobium sp. CCGUVB23]|uniref:hypothetical protein n=1 Tax=Bradyrhizobium sp. CCGUVB23 TaxID=2949630 RepID=UPI0020B2D964|nr:hypothetical protein [Bradyrhizobium sp. CCGUVB23]MCP3459742.1 hypothetical protein [Bradyrhizobium sp. CCGUVB23]